MPVKFVAVNLTPAARDALRHAAVVVSAELGERVSMSDALLTMKAVADRHRSEIKEAAEAIIDREGTSDDSGQ